MLVLNFNEKPAAIVRIMDEARRQDAAHLASSWKQLYLFALFIPAGFIFVILDELTGGGFISLALAGYACWLVALGGWLYIRQNRTFSQPTLLLRVESAKTASSRASRKAKLNFLIFLGGVFFFVVWLIFTSLITKGNLTFSSFLITCLLPFSLAYLYIRVSQRSRTGNNFGPKFTLARTVLESLKDDVAPKRTFTGWLDLTGLQQVSKRVRERESDSGMPVNYYRDEWLRMKAPLYDGSLLRVSAVERTKARMGRWKRGRRSGRRKWKPGEAQSSETLRLAVIPNPETHQLNDDMRAFNRQMQRNVGCYQIQSLSVRDGRLECLAVSYKAVRAQDLLQMMRYVHQFVQPKQPV